MLNLHVRRLCVERSIGSKYEFLLAQAKISNMLENTCEKMLMT
jgi:hypothetical protein